MIVHADTPQDAVAAIRAHIDATRKALLVKCGPAEASGSTGGRILALGDLLAELSDVTVLAVPVLMHDGTPIQEAI
jgi:hypothetical protein